MENASKALLIAGAILICILLIAIGMYVYNSANATIKSAASQMSQQEKDIYNAKLSNYSGTAVKGSEVISMIETVISMNQENANTSGKFISITTGSGENAIKNYTDGSNLDKNCNACNFYGKVSTGTYAQGPEANSDNTEANVKAASDSMQKLKTKINSSKKYTVENFQEEGVIVAISISQNK